MKRLTARIRRLETLDGAGENDELLSDAELEARICQLAETLTTDWRNRGMSAADILAEDLDWRVDHRALAALFAEVQAPAFDAARFLAAVNGEPADPGVDAPDAPQ